MNHMMMRGQESWWKAGGAKATLALSSTHPRPALQRGASAIVVLHLICGPALGKELVRELPCTISPGSSRRKNVQCSSSWAIREQAACGEVKSLLWLGSFKSIVSPSDLLMSGTTGHFSCMLGARSTRPQTEFKATSLQLLLGLNLPIQQWVK